MAPGRRAATVPDHEPRAGDLDKLWAHVHEPPPALREVRPELPPEPNEAVARALATEAADRPPTAGDLAREARSALGG
jgi:serine/threonine-protein kinase